MKERKWVGKHMVLRFNDIVRHVKSEKYARVLVHRMVKAGKINRVAKGVYSTSDDIFAIASNVYFPSYISFISACYLYGFTQTIPVAIYIATPKKRKPVEAMNYRIYFVPIKQMWGYRKDGEMFVADVEKLMIDAFLRPECMGNFSEMEQMFTNSPAPDPKKLKMYIMKLGINKVYRQVGYMLEKHKKIDISGWMDLNRNYYVLNPFYTGKKTDKKWRLRI